LVNDIVTDFESIEINNTVKPKVGLVGEILVKFHPDANNHVVDYIESEGGEAVMPDLTDFFFYILKNMEVKATDLYYHPMRKYASKALIGLLNKLRKPIIVALNQSSRYTSPKGIHEIAKGAKNILSLSNQTGEGWFLTGEMVELIESGTENIICMQPFACLPNHITGKAVFKEIRNQYPGANIVAVDYDPGASEVNQMNRIKLMLAVALKKMGDNKLGTSELKIDEHEAYPSIVAS
jgi:predicted nucleotide-binding protein (sugar kinase/HSP70/actin superfamily)